MRVTFMQFTWGWLPYILIMNSRLILILNWREFLDVLKFFAVQDTLLNHVHIGESERTKIEPSKSPLACG